MIREVVAYPHVRPLCEDKAPSLCSVLQRRYLHRKSSAASSSNFLNQLCLAMSPITPSLALTSNPKIAEVSRVAHVTACFQRISSYCDSKLLRDRSKRHPIIIRSGIPGLRMFPQDVGDSHYANTQIADEVVSLVKLPRVTTREYDETLMQIRCSLFLERVYTRENHHFSNSSPGSKQTMAILTLFCSKQPLQRGFELCHSSIYRSLHVTYISTSHIQEQKVKRPSGHSPAHPQVAFYAERNRAR